MSIFNKNDIFKDDESIKKFYLSLGDTKFYSYGPNTSLVLAEKKGPYKKGTPLDVILTDLCYFYSKKEQLLQEK